MKNAGFTLLEIIVSLSLIFLFSGFWVYQNTFLPLLQQQSIEQFVSDIRYIKQLGLQGDAQARIVLDREQNLYTLYSHEEKKVVHFQNGVSLHTYSLKEVSFYDTAWTKGNTIVLKAKIHRKTTPYTIKIASITGRIKLE